MTDGDREPPESWHLDKKVPVAIILTLALQFVGGVWFAAKMDARLVAIEEFRDDSKGDATRLAVLETQTAAIQADLSEVKSILRRLEANLFQGGGGKP